MPTSNAASVQARVCSAVTPPAKVSQEPREISDTSRSELPNLRYNMMVVLRSCRNERLGCLRAAGNPERHLAIPSLRLSAGQGRARLRRWVGQLARIGAGGLAAGHAGTAGACDGC